MPVTPEQLEEMTVLELVELKKALASTVRDLMVTDPPTLSSGDTVEAAATLMHDPNISHVCVVDGGRLVGIVARGDLVRFLASTT